jgi:hypothetical protein
MLTKNIASAPLLSPPRLPLPPGGATTAASLPVLGAAARHDSEMREARVVMVGVAVVAMLLLLLPSPVGGAVPRTGRRGGAAVTVQTDTLPRALPAVRAVRCLLRSLRCGREGSRRHWGRARRWRKRGAVREGDKGGGGGGGGRGTRRGGIRAAAPVTVRAACAASFRPAKRRWWMWVPRRCLAASLPPSFSLAIPSEGVSERGRARRGRCGQRRAAARCVYECLYRLYKKIKCYLIFLNILLFAVVV